MSRRYACGSLLALLVLAVSAPATAATYSVTPSGDTSGTTDTAAIQGYLDLCTRPHRGCRIQLGPGQFWVKQLVAENFHGTLRGMGADTTIVSPIEDLPVNPLPSMWDSYPTRAGEGNEWPLLVTFIGGNVRVSDLGFEVLDPTPTTEWRSEDDQPRFNLLAVVHVAGASAHSAIERVSVKGVASDIPGPGYSIWAGVQFRGLAGIRMKGRHSVSSSRFQSLGSGVYARFLERASVTVGGRAGRGNTIEDCWICNAADSVSQSVIDISGNHITTHPRFSVGIGIGLWQNEADKVSRFEARHNTINHLAVFGRGVCVGDYVHGATGRVTQHAIVSHNRIEMGPLEGWQEGIGVTDAYGALLAGNTISGQSIEDIGAYGATRCKILVNELSSSSFPKILLNSGTSRCLVVTDDPSAVMDDGTDNRIFSPHH